MSIKVVPSLFIEFNHVPLSLPETLVIPQNKAKGYPTLTVYVELIITGDIGSV